MKSFFKLSSLKIKTTLVLIVYVLVGTVFLSSYNTYRYNTIGSTVPRELNTFDRVAMVIAYPAVFLSLPGLYVIDNAFIGKTTLSKILTDGGCSNCTNEKYNKPIKQSTSLGLVAGFITEVFFLYVIAGVFALFKNFKTKSV